MNHGTTHDDLSRVISHLTPENWERANRHLVGKALAEFAHERLLTPEDLGDARFRVPSDDGATEYVFVASAPRTGPLADRRVERRAPQDLERAGTGA